MNANIIRRLALPVASAGIIGGAALGMAGMANAATPTQPTGPGYSYAPSVKAHPAPEAQAGARWHKGSHHLAVLQPTTVK
jgi:ABC-type phosphate transport system permease subunit